MNNKAVIYARVSSKEQERMGFSIPAQIKLIRKYAIKNDIDIVTEFVEAETAKKAGRTKFNEMVTYLKKNKSIRIVLVEKTDRMYRNFDDRVLMSKIDGLQIHFVKEGNVISSDSKSQDKFRHDIDVAMSSYYSNNLSEEIKKGMQEKAEQGYLPGRTPYGYTRSYNSKDIEIKEEEAKFVQKAFEIYSKGDISLESTSIQLYDLGFTYQKNMPKINRGTLEKMLKNPFYKGYFIFKKEIFEGKHPQIISLELFNKVQFAFRRANKPEYISKEFLLSGLMTCAECGCSVVGEIKKGKYIYYHCTWGKGKDTCGQKKYIKQADLDAQIVEALLKFKVTNHHKNWIKEAVKRVDKKQQAHSKVQIKKYQTEIEKIKDRIHKIYNDKLDGLIDQDFWLEQHNSYKIQMERHKTLVDAFDRADLKSMEEMNMTLELAEEASELYLGESNEYKRRIIKASLSNLTLKDGKLSYEYKEPFDILVKGLSCLKKWRIGDSNS